MDGVLELFGGLEAFEANNGRGLESCHGGE
jgi:hypothetical protein